MHVRPLHDRLLVRRLEAGEQNVGRIIIPDSAKEKPQQGQVIAVGNGRMNAKGQRVPLAVQPGDRILFGKYAQEVTLSGETYVILREEEVLAVMDTGRSQKATHTRPKTTSKKRIAKKFTKPKLKKKAKRK